MTIITETVIMNGRAFVHNYSDKNVFIRKVGTEELYEDSYDLPEKGYTYEETDIKKEEDENE